MPECKICVIDDDLAIRDAMQLLLQLAGYPAATFESARAFLDSGVADQCSCVIADIRMPDMDGLELQQELGRRNPNLPMIIMTGHGDVPLAVRAMKSGAIDFLEKPFAEEALLESLRIALESNGKGGEPSAEVIQIREKLAELTPRERQVLDQIVDGHQNKMIAHNLNISARTVEVYRGRVMEKMNARTVAELVRLTLSAKA